MSYTLDEVSEKTGRPQATLRKLIERGQLIAEKEGNRTYVTEEALESFLGAEVLEDIADEVRQLNWGPARALMARLPDRIRHALALGIQDARKPIVGPTGGTAPNPTTSFGSASFGAPKAAPKPSKKKK